MEMLRNPRRIQAWRELFELRDRELMRRIGGEPDVLLEAGQIEPGEADGDRECGPA